MLNAFNRILGLTMQSLTGEANQTTPTLSLNQPMNRTHKHHNHLNSDPVPYAEHLQQWDAMAVGGQRGDGGRMQGDGRERGSRPKKRQKAGLGFRT